MNRNEFEKAVYDPANGLTASQVGILLWYANHKNWKNNGLAWGSADTIAKDIRYSERTVAGNRPDLVESGWLVDSGQRAFNAKGRPAVKYDLAVGTFPAKAASKSTDLSCNDDRKVQDEDVDLSCKSEDLSCKSDVPFLQSRGDFPATVAEEHDIQHVKEHVKEHVATPEAGVARYHYVVRDGSQALPNSTKSAPPVYVMDLEGVTGPLTAVEPRRILTPGEQKVLDNQLRIHVVQTPDAARVIELVRGTKPNKNIYDAVADALRAVGIEVQEDEW